MSRQDPLGNTQHPTDRVKYVTVVRSVRLWYRGCNGSLWVHPSTVINILPGSGNINTTIQTHNGGVVPVTVSQSSRLFEVDDAWLNSGVRMILCVSPECVCDTYRPYYFSSRKHDLSQLFRTYHPITSETFSEQSGHS